MGPMSEVIKSVRQFSRRKTPLPRNDRLGSAFGRQYLLGAGPFCAGRSVPADTGLDGDAMSAKKVVAPFPQVGTSRYPWRFQCSSLIAQFESPIRMIPQPLLRPRTARILVVEDEVLTRAFIAEELRLAGFRVIEADRADDGLTYIKAAVEQVDLVFSDIQTPGSLDGLQLAEILRDKYPDIPVILTSGNAPPRHVGIVEAFVPKPYDVTQTIALMSAILAQKSPGEPL
jgi:two-component system, response regulator PdtaR